MLATLSGCMMLVFIDVRCETDGSFVLPQDGWTALIFASHKGHSEVAQMLLTAGVNKEAANSNEAAAPRNPPVPQKSRDERGKVGLWFVEQRELLRLAKMKNPPSQHELLTETEECEICKTGKRQMFTFQSKVKHFKSEKHRKAVKAGEPSLCALRWDCCLS